MEFITDVEIDAETYHEAWLESLDTALDWRNSEVLTQSAELFVDNGDQMPKLTANSG